MAENRQNVLQVLNLSPHTHEERSHPAREAMKLEKQKSAHLLVTLKPALGEGRATLPPVRPQPSGEGRNPLLPQRAGPQEQLHLPQQETLGSFWCSPSASRTPLSSYLASHHITGLVFLAKPKPLLGDPSLDLALAQPETGDQDLIPLSRPASLVLGVSKMMPVGYRAPAARRPPPASQHSWQRQPHWASWSMTWCHFS